LVVIGVMGLLAALLLPARSKGRTIRVPEEFCPTLHRETGNIFLLTASSPRGSMEGK
jgi:hypothetical protein